MAENPDSHDHVLPKSTRNVRVTSFRTGHYSPFIGELRYERSRKNQVTWSMEPYCFLGYSCIAGKITGFCTLECKNMSEKGFKMHISLQLYIERTFGKTQSVVLGGNPRHHRFFLRKVALIFRL